MDTSFTVAEFNPQALWPDYRPTDLVDLPQLAHRARVGRVLVKLENQRPLGNFKSLGGVYAGLRALARHAAAHSIVELRRSRLPPLLCASDGNHGLAVAAAAQIAGTAAYVYLPFEISLQREARITALGSNVIRIDGTYDDAVEAAQAGAAAGIGLLVPDTSTDSDDVVVADVMAGYALITDELKQQLHHEIQDKPTHAFIQAGVGGLAAAMAKGLAGQWRSPGQLLTVEPAFAACVASALEIGRPQLFVGELHTSASLLSCGMASAVALPVLLQHNVKGIIVSEDELEAAVVELRKAGGPETTTSGAAGLAGFLRTAKDPQLRKLYALDNQSCVLLLVTEGAEMETIGLSPVPCEAHPALDRQTG